MRTTHTVPTVLPAKEEAIRTARRSFLGLSMAGLATPLLHACGGGGNGASGGFPLEAEPPNAAHVGASSGEVPWQATREAFRDALPYPACASVALLAEESVQWQEAYGFTGITPDRPDTIETRLNIGSVSKLFATLAVMMMRDAGLLSLDQPVAELLRDCGFSMKSPEYNQVTVRHLLNHSSGFPGSNYRNVDNFAPIPGYAQATLASLQASRLKHAPGELSVYCNDGFTMVELLVPIVSGGLSYTDYIQRGLLDPLGMSRTGFALAPADAGTFAPPWRGQQMLPQEMMAAYAAGGVISTPTDMMKLARLFMNDGVFEGRRIVSADGLREMATDQSAHTRINLPAPSWRWGLGWDTVAQPAMEAAGMLGWKKGGDTEFFHSDFIVLPKARIAVMMITSHSLRADPLALAEDLLLRRAASQLPVMPAPIVPVVPPMAPSAPDVSELTGIYARETAPIQVLAASDGALTVRFWDGKVWVAVDQGLRLRTDGWWWTDSAPDRHYGFKTVEKHLYLTRRFLSGNRLYWNEEPVAQWLPEADAPLPEAWRKRVGSQWEGTNDDPQSFEGKYGSRTGIIGELTERPGYVMWNNAQLLRVINDLEAGMVVKAPVLAGRDLVELRVEGDEAAAPLHVGALVFRRKPREGLA